MSQEPRAEWHFSCALLSLASCRLRAESLARQLCSPPAPVARALSMDDEHGVISCPPASQSPVPPPQPLLNGHACRDSSPPNFLVRTGRALYARLASLLQEQGAECGADFCDSGRSTPPAEEIAGGRAGPSGIAPVFPYPVAQDLMRPPLPKEDSSSSDLTVVEEVFQDAADGAVEEFNDEICEENAPTAVMKKGQPEHVAPSDDTEPPPLVFETKTGFTPPFVPPLEDTGVDFPPLQGTAVEFPPSVGYTGLDSLESPPPENVEMLAMPLHVTGSPLWPFELSSQSLTETSLDVSSLPYGEISSPPTTDLSTPSVIESSTTSPVPQPDSPLVPDGSARPASAGSSCPVQESSVRPTQDSPAVPVPALGSSTPPFLGSSSPPVLGSSTPPVAESPTSSVQESSTPPSAPPVSLPSPIPREDLVEIYGKLSSPPSTEPGPPPSNHIGGAQSVSPVMAPSSLLSKNLAETPLKMLSAPPATVPSPPPCKVLHEAPVKEPSAGIVSVPSLLPNKDLADTPVKEQATPPSGKDLAEASVQELPVGPVTAPSPSATIDVTETAIEVPTLQVTAYDEKTSSSIDDSLELELERKESVKPKAPRPSRFSRHRFSDPNDKSKMIVRQAFKVVDAEEEFKSSLLAAKEALVMSPGTLSPDRSSEVPTIVTSEDEDSDRTPLIRSTSLKTGKTLPGTPYKKKIVRFADALGLDLAAVRTIVSDELPSVPLSAFAQLSDHQPSSRGKTRFVSGVGLDIMDTEEPSGSFVPLFEQPGALPDFWARLRNQRVCLESVVPSGAVAHSVIRVMNVAFEKLVVLRYSVDSWKSFKDIRATFLPSSSDGFSDRFAADVRLESPTPGTIVQMCIKYVVGGVEYWDNNGGANYWLEYQEKAKDGPEITPLMNYF